VLLRVVGALHNGRAVLTAKGTNTHAVRAIYSGDGNNAPSSGSG
jgi:hypothetical protein